MLAVLLLHNLRHEGFCVGVDKMLAVFLSRNAGFCNLKKCQFEDNFQNGEREIN